MKGYGNIELSGEILMEDAPEKNEKERKTCHYRRINEIERKAARDAKVDKITTSHTEHN